MASEQAYLGQFTGTDELDYLIEDASAALSVYFPGYPIALTERHYCGFEGWLLAPQVDIRADFDTTWAMLEKFHDEWWVNHRGRKGAIDLLIDIEWVSEDAD